MTKKVFDCYLAIPYSHENYATRALRYIVACEATAKLIGKGRSVYSPIVHSHPLTYYDLPGDWEYWKGVDEAIIPACSEMIVLQLPGVEESVGVNAEIEIAEEHGVPVVYAVPAELLNDSTDRRDMRTTCEVLSKILHTKNKGYGSSIFESAIVAPKESEQWRVATRMDDKLRRIMNAGGLDKAEVNDVMDLAGYAVLEVVRRKKEVES